MWAHCKCYGIKGEGCSVLELDEIMWVCKGCRGKLDEKIRLIKLEEKQEKFEEKQTTFESVLVNVKAEQQKMVNMQTSYEQEMRSCKDELGRVAKELNENTEALQKLKEEFSNSGTGEKALFTRKDIVEEINIDKRKYNLMFKGIKEEENYGEVVNIIIRKLGGEEMVRQLN